MGNSHEKKFYLKKNKYIPTEYAPGYMDIENRVMYRCIYKLKIYNIQKTSCSKYRLVAEARQNIP